MTLLLKTLSLSEVELKFDGEAGSFAGYASVFNGKDTYGDTILPGAFTKTVKAKLPKMFYNHDWDMPVGKYMKVAEDNKGLWVEGELTPGLTKAMDLRAAMKHGTIDGLSIGGILKKGDYEDTSEGGRIIKTWSNLIEVSPVVFPADNKARIRASSIKSDFVADDIEQEIASIETVRQFESFLRDVGGFSKGAVQSLTARAKVMFTEREVSGEQVDAKSLSLITERIARLAGEKKA